MALPPDELHAAGDALPRPFEHCYWLLPGRVLAGEHPGARGSTALMAQRLRTLQACGVGCFIDLTTAADPLPSYTPLAARRLSLPIGDFGLPSTATMRAALDAIAAEENALDEAALPAARREQVRRYFTELRKRFEKEN